MVLPIKIWQSVHRFKPLSPQASDDRSFCTCSDAAVWVAEQLDNCPQETQSHMVWAKVPYKAIKPFVLWHGSVLLFGFRSISLGNDHSVMSYNQIRRPLKPVLTEDTFYPKTEAFQSWTASISIKKMARSSLFQPLTEDFPNLGKLARRQTSKKRMGKLYTHNSDAVVFDISTYCPSSILQFAEMSIFRGWNKWLQQSFECATFAFSLGKLVKHLSSFPSSLVNSQSVYSACKYCLCSHKPLCHICHCKARHMAVLRCSTGN